MPDGSDTRRVGGDMRLGVVVLGCALATIPAVLAGDAGDEPLQIVHEQGLEGQTRPFSGYIDPGEDLDPSEDMAVVGLTSCTLRFNRDVYSWVNEGEDVGVDDFEITETGGGEPPVITAVGYVDGDRSLVKVEWDRPITLQEWTTIRADVSDEAGNRIENLGSLGEAYEPDRVDFAFLPADVDQSGVVSPLDLFTFRVLVRFPEQAPELGTLHDYLDNDRTGSINPLCLFRLRTLIYGGNTTKVWAQEGLYADRP